MQVQEQQINILLVDDNPGNLLALEAVLGAPDRNLVKVASGAEALRYLLDQDAAVILLDVHMPTIDGLQTAELIRGRNRSRNVPIIFLTANDSAGSSYISKAYSLGAVDFFIKPFDPVALKSKVAVFVELFKKTLQVEQQAELLRRKNIQIETANLRRLSKLVELGQRLAEVSDPARLLQTFCHAARDILGARYAAVGIRDSERRELHYFFTSGCEFIYSPDDSFSQDDRQALINELKELCSAHFSEVDKGAPATPRASHRRPFKSLLRTPISFPKQGGGWLLLAEKIDEEEFSEADEQQAVTLASQVASAYENARLYVQAERHALELEQEMAERRLAEEEKARLLRSEQAARAEAEAANRLKDEFLATVSHELRTPLNALLGWIYMLRSGALSADQTAHALETAERNARAQNKLIEDLLDVSRIMTGKLQLEIAPVDILAVIRAAVEIVGPLAKAKGIEFRVDLESAAAPVQGDRNRLQQVVWNLLSNAIKFTPSGGHALIRFRNLETAAEIIVEDTGQGISLEFLPYVFERFRQASSGSTRKHGGLGLGLAIVRQLVELHGGTVQAHSDGIGRGSTFIVRLPRLETQNNSLPVGLTPMNEDVPLFWDVLPTLEGVSVLVIDDEAGARELIAAMLSQHGAVVSTVSSAAAGLAALDRGHFDVILSDIEMPEEDGFAFIRQLIARKLSPPAAALTAYARADDRNRALRAGFRAHLTKPVEPNELLTVVADLSGRISKS